MRRYLKLFFVAFYLFSVTAFADTPVKIPILTYHNFDPVTPGSMTVSTQLFEEQLKWLKENGYSVIPLMVVVDYLRGITTSLPPKSVVIVADDGRNTVYTYMLPIVRKYNVPVTLFIYPSSIIAKAPYALTWEQVKELKQTGLFDIQSHTFWHPNFNQDKKQLSPDAYKQFVEKQLVKSKKVLEEKLGIKVTLLAWPYGIYDSYLEEQAAKAGYIMAFSIDDRSACRSEKQMAMPRYMVWPNLKMTTFISIVSGLKVKK